MDRVALINKVKVRIDEISPLDTPIYNVGVADDKPVDNIIDSLLDECAVEILLMAPFNRIDVTQAATSVHITQSNVNPTTGLIEVPDDFLRLVSLKMSDWQRDVTELSIKGDELSRRQSNKFLRAGVSRPVGVLAKNDKGMYIEYYSTFEQEHKLVDFSYIARKTAEQIDNIQIIEAMCWLCASKVLTIFGKSGEAAYNNVQNLMV